MARAIVIICSMFYFDSNLSAVCGVLLAVHSCLGGGERRMRSVISVIVIIREEEVR